MKIAHITSRPGYEVGEKVLGLCGEEFKVKVLWDDVPRDKTICRDCVDVALHALTEADSLIVDIRRRSHMALVRMQMINDSLNSEPPTLLDAINIADGEHLTRQIDKALTKAEKKRAKQVCTCTWSSPEVFEVDPSCPIHAEKQAEALTEEIVELPEEDQS